MRGIRPALLLVAAPVVAALVLLVVIPGISRAFDLPPADTGRSVYDFEDIWTKPEIDAAQRLADAALSRTGVQVAIVSIPTDRSKVSPNDAKADAAGIMDAWHVGRAGINDGLVVLFDMDTSGVHGQIYLYGGSGFLSTYLTEADLGAIVARMLPLAHAGDMDGALAAGLAEIDAALQPGGNPALGREDQRIIGMSAIVVAPGLLLLAAFLFTWWRRGRDARTRQLAPGSFSVLPPRLTPALAAMVRMERDHPSVFWAGLIDIAQRGWVLVDQDARRRIALTPSDRHATTPDLWRALGRPETGLVSAIGREAAAFGGSLGAKAMAGKSGTRIRADFGRAVAAEAREAGWFAIDPIGGARAWGRAGAALALVAVLAFGAAAMLNVFAVIGRVGLAASFLVPLVAGFGVMAGSFVLSARSPLGAEVEAFLLGAHTAIVAVLGSAASVEEAWRRIQQELPWVETADDLVAWSVAVGASRELGRLLKRDAAVPGAVVTVVEAAAGSQAAASSARGAGVYSPVWYSGQGPASFGTFVGSVTSSGSGGGSGGGSSAGGGGAGGGF
jgi:uncharacterized membrane protein YgcG